MHMHVLVGTCVHVRDDVTQTDLTTPISFRGRKFSRATFNTGFVTFINHGLRQNDGLTEIVFSHELGHNWGSEVSYSLVLLEC